MRGSGAARALLAGLCAAAAASLAAAVPTFVMLPLSAVGNDGTLADPTGLRNDFNQLKSAGVAGVMGDVWWGLCERAGPQQYNFSAYQQLADLVASAGLEYHPVMSFHQCGGNVGDTCNIPLPQWVRDAGNSDAGIWYTDAEGNIDTEYVSLWADELPLFDNQRTLIQAYGDYVTAFAKALDSHMGSTITSMEISMGPAGELRYPSYPLSRWNFCGVGEFQCYSSYALKSLASAAAAAGHPEWGHGGPSNAGNYNSHPSDTQFFAAGGFDNYASDYGKFFLGWYFQELLSHGDRVLTAVTSAVSGYKVQVAGKVSGVHWWYKDPSHAAELTAGYFNTDSNNAYAQIASLFKKHGAAFDFTCMEMQDSEQPASCACGPYELVQQAKGAADSAGIPFAGENALPRYDQTAYNTIMSQATSGGHDIEQFTYLRLGPTLLSSNNFGTFENFVKTLASK